MRVLDIEQGPVELLSLEAFLFPISYRQDSSLMTFCQFQMAEQLIIKGGMARKFCGKIEGLEIIKISRWIT